MIHLLSVMIADIVSPVSNDSVQWLFWCQTKPRANRKQQFVNIVILCITAEMVFSCQFCIKNTAAAADSWEVWNDSELSFYWMILSS